MSVRHYTADQLLALRESPLVCKPENLPAIEAWIEYVSVEIDGERQKLRIPHSESQQQSQSQRLDGTTVRRSQQRPVTGGEASPMGNFSAGSRPGLVQLRSQASRSGGKKPPKSAGILQPRETTLTTTQRTSRLAHRRPCSLQAGLSQGSQILLTRRTT